MRLHFGSGNVGWHWTELGRRNPFGAVLATSGEQSPAREIDDFFATGREDVARLIVHLARVAPLVRRRAALDFGCGVGRLTRALADHFERVEQPGAIAPIAPGGLAHIASGQIQASPQEFGPCVISKYPWIRPDQVPD